MQLTNEWWVLLRPIRYMSGIIQLSKTTSSQIVPAPTITIQVNINNGQVTFCRHPPRLQCRHLCSTTWFCPREHIDNVAKSNFTPRAVSGSFLHPNGKLPNVQFHLNGRDACDYVHIYPSLSSAVISWLIAKQLGILPEGYPQPTPALHRLTTVQQPIAEFPTVLDGQIRTMLG